jgi:hypothetical protein
MRFACLAAVDAGGVEVDIIRETHGDCNPRLELALRRSNTAVVSCGCFVQWRYADSESQGMPSALLTPQPSLCARSEFIIAMDGYSVFLDIEGGV